MDIITAVNIVLELAEMGKLSPKLIDSSAMADEEKRQAKAISTVTKYLLTQWGEQRS